MRVFVFTYDRYDSLTTPMMLEADGVPHTVLCHSEADRQRFIDGGRVRPENIIATGEPKGLANQRNWCLEHMERDEWTMQFVDDLKTTTEVADYETRGHRLGISIDNQREFKGQMQVPISLTKFMVRADEVVEACEKVGARLGGFCGIANPVFRDAKWRFNVIVDGRAWVMKKGKLRFDTGAQMVDDVCFTAQNIEQYGVVVVNQWVLPDCRRYTVGAFNSIDQRMEQKMTEAAHLVKTYPGTLRYADKAGWPPFSHVALRRTIKNDLLREFERLVVREVVAPDHEAKVGVQ